MMENSYCFRIPCWHACCSQNTALLDKFAVAWYSNVHFDFAPLAYYPLGVLGYAGEAVQLRDVNRSAKRRAEAMSGGGRYLKDLGD